MTRTVEGALGRDRAMAMAGLAGVTALCWWATLGWGAHAHHRPGLASALVLWVVMMAGMMLPSAAPRVLGVAGAGAPDGRRRLGQATAFTGGYLAAWAVFSVLAALAEHALRAAAADPAALIGNFAGGLLLMAAGLYQLSPLKQACLGHCRAPLVVPAAPAHRTAAALRAGLADGAVCIGSCWGLMAVLVVTGSMDPWAMAALTVLVVLEKAAPGGPAIARAAGVALIAFGSWTFMHA